MIDINNLINALSDEALMQLKAKYKLKLTEIVKALMTGEGEIWQDARLLVISEKYGSNSKEYRSLMEIYKEKLFKRQET